MARTSATPAWQLALIVLTSTVVGVVALAVLYWAQSVCIPVALAIFFTFLLATPTQALERRGLGRTLSVLVVVTGAVLVLGAVVWVVAIQAKSLVVEAPRYTENIKGKIKSLRAMGQGPGARQLEKMIGEIGGELGAGGSPPKSDGADKAAPALRKPPEVVVQPESPAWLSALPALLGRMAETMGGLAMAVVLLIFMLLGREDLRNRLLRLMGHGRITAATKALDDAGQRISRYLLMQLIVNGTYGLAIALGLWAIGVNYALLWGFLAFVLRYIPYVGPWIAAIMPILLSLAMFEGWTQPLLVIGLFLVVELISNNAVEPALYGPSIGVSTVALLVAAAFWAFLWGPIGLVLSSPLTVCLVVLGKHVPHLEFLTVLLGDEPVLAPDVVYYQRLLARDQDEATELVLERLEEPRPEEVYDELLIPALSYAKRDRQRGDLTEDDQQCVLEATGEILEDLGERRATSDAADDRDAPSGGDVVKVRILACPARDESDRLALGMLQQLLDPARWEIEATAVESLTSEVVAQVAQQGAALICIGALPPGGLAHTRYLCKRLRARFPKIKIIVGRWGLKGSLEANQRQLEEAGADVMVTTLLETRTQLRGLLPVLVHQTAQLQGPHARPDDSPPPSTEDQRRAELVAGS